VKLWIGVVRGFEGFEGIGDRGSQNCPPSNLGCDCRSKDRRNGRKVQNQPAHPMPRPRHIDDLLAMEPRAETRARIGTFNA
jgi:hypothetical protein